MTANNSKSCLSYSNKLENQHNNTYLTLLIKTLLMLIILL